MAPVNTPPKEAHVLNDAILRAAIDLNKRDRTRRKIIMIISDGSERGSQAGYKEVLASFKRYGIQVRAVVLDRVPSRSTKRSRRSITSGVRDTRTFCRNTSTRPVLGIS